MRVSVIRMIIRVMTVTLQSKSRLVPLYAANTILPTIPAPSLRIQVMVAARGVAVLRTTMRCQYYQPITRCHCYLSPTPRPPNTAAVARLPDTELAKA